MELHKLINNRPGIKKNLVLIALIICVLACPILMYLDYQLLIHVLKDRMFEADRKISYVVMCNISIIIILLLKAIYELHKRTK
jgi:hypothetical protein